MDLVQNIISKLQLEPHPEGGYFKETYRSNGSISQDNLSADFTGSRNYSTCIYFLLTSDTFSAFHRINQDEIWHYYKGTSLKLHMISTDGSYTYACIGNNLDKGEIPQFVVPAKYWFAAEVIDNNSYSLLGCTVFPGFDFRDFELTKRNVLLEKFPQHSEIIQKLTRA